MGSIRLSVALGDGWRTAIHEPHAKRPADWGSFEDTEVLARFKLHAYLIPFNYGKLTMHAWEVYPALPVEWPAYIVTSEKKGVI